ncbi:hypothetical protein GCM10011371_29630 [Novosphingobium marinum]|uniref:SnoaL-like domain-containing protein n=1 Tax=Novosphingobium marinum TaxID=1514948 RepID=A0A7Y9XYG0_9SPHN|nr:nuclear transport factor 2 family protein [Novosphingobium marinum]NYH96775.1 hypothetical protein [Novosphingobium marinum]GGC40344.1 hypothetical protein GCM10011371_29630 [Novosphingobium marinum]
MMTLEELSAREEIRQLRIDYSTFFDSKDEAAIRSRFIPDIVCHYPESYGGSYEGVDAVIGLFRATWANLKNPFEVLHLTSNHHIELTGPDKATGHCMLLDLINQQEEGVPHATRGGHANPLLLIGRYEDEYVKRDGRWLFSQIKLSALWPDWQVT